MTTQAAETILTVCSVAYFVALVIFCYALFLRGQGEGEE